MSHDYKIEYKNSEDDVSHVKYIHALDPATAQTIFRHSWVHEHGDNSNPSDSPKVLDLSVLDHGRWVHEHEEE